MLVFHTQIHLVTFIFIVLETVMLAFQFFYYLFRPEDKNRLYYLILLILLLVYNITGGLFPDPNIPLAVPYQEMIAYGSGFLMASYFPFYFYKAFELKSLRWHAFYGVPLFLVLPYIIFFVIDYAVAGNLDKDLKYGMLAPFLYALVLLWVMFRAIHQQHEVKRNNREFMEEIAMYVAVSPWASLALFGFVEESQVVEVLVTNTGIVAITLLFIWKSIQKTRSEYRNSLQSQLDQGDSEIQQRNFVHFKLTRMEIEITQRLLKGHRNKDIADDLHISEETVKKHIYNVYKKTNVRNRTSLLHKLRNSHFNVALAFFI